jgi:hypothetical protein
MVTAHNSGKTEPKKGMQAIRFSIDEPSACHWSQAQ